MPEHPEREIEQALRAYGAKRRNDAGPPLELHPATRRLLQGEVARVWGRRPGARKPWFAWLQALSIFWPRLAIASVLAVGLGVSTWWMLHTGPQPMRLAQDKRPVPASASPADDVNKPDLGEGMAPAVATVRGGDAPAAPPPPQAAPTPTPTDSVLPAAMREAEPMAARPAPPKSVAAPARSAVPTSPLTRGMVRGAEKIADRSGQPEADSALTATVAKPEPERFHSERPPAEQSRQTVALGGGGLAQSPPPVVSAPVPAPTDVPATRDLQEPAPPPVVAKALGREASPLTDERAKADAVASRGTSLAGVGGRAGADAESRMLRFGGRQDTLQVTNVASLPRRMDPTGLASDAATRAQESSTKKAVRAELTPPAGVIGPTGAGISADAMKTSLAESADTQLARRTDLFAARETNEPRNGALLTTGERLLFEQVAAVNGALSRSRAQPAAAALRSFQLERRGHEVRIIDADGSVYVGQTVDVLQRQKESLASSGWRAVANGTGADSPADVGFTVTGTNRTLGQGVWVQATLQTSPPDAGIGGTTPGAVLPAMRPAATPAREGSSVEAERAKLRPRMLRLVGQARIGTNETALHAVQVAPQ